MNITIIFLLSKQLQHYHSHHLEDNLLLLVRKQINSFMNSSSTLLLLLLLLLLLSSSPPPLPPLLFIFLLLLFLYLPSFSAQDGTITLWDLSSTRAIRELKGHTSRVTSLTYSSDGTLLGSCGYDNTINLWNIKSILAPTRYDMYCEYL